MWIPPNYRRGKMRDRGDEDTFKFINKKKQKRVGGTSAFPGLASRWTDIKRIK